jgi:site-specific DNA-methyltransferase (adenine-specific)
MLAFGGTRTWHRLACAVEDAGFEIRDSIAWLYGSGFPKSLDVSKAIDKAAGAERPILDTIPDRWAGKGNVLQRSTQAPA